MELEQEQNRERRRGRSRIGRRGLGEGSRIENWEELEEQNFKQNGKERVGRSRIWTSGGAGAESGAEWGEESRSSRALISTLGSAPLAQRARERGGNHSYFFVSLLNS